MRQANITAPPDIDRRIAADAQEAGRVALAMARESLRLQKAFDDAEVPASFIKGSALAMLAYGELSIKQSWDIDLITTPERVVDARRLLEQLGYVLFQPAGLSDIQFDRLIPRGMEVIFRHRESGICVELHWRLVASRELLGGISPASAPQSIPLGGASLKTLNDESLFAYLCVHGAFHGWSRLKWLADVAAFVSHREDREVEHLFDAACKLGAGRAPALTLLLCGRLFETSLPPALQLGFDRDRILKGLAANANSYLIYGSGDAEIVPNSILDLRIQASCLLIGGTTKYLIAELWRRWVSIHDRTFINLPSKLAFLYHFMRIPLWLYRRFGQATHRPG
jgi:hypothetical protein